MISSPSIISGVRGTPFASMLSSGIKIDEWIIGMWGIPIICTCKSGAQVNGIVLYCQFVAMLRMSIVVNVAS